MFLVAAAILAFAWVAAFFFGHVTYFAVHVLAGLALVSLWFHFLHPRKYNAPRMTLPKDAIK